jgi:hypothetical protein
MFECLTHYLYSERVHKTKSEEVDEDSMDSLDALVGDDGFWTEPTVLPSKATVPYSLPAVPEDVGCLKPSTKLVSLHHTYINSR